MDYRGFCGPSNQSQSLIANSERTVNFYAERIQSRFAPNEAALYPTPGRRSLFTTQDVGGRGYFEAAGRAFHVIGGGFYESFEVAVPTRIHAVAQDNNLVTFAYNSASGGQLVFSSGTNAYHYNLTTGAFTTVLTGEATMVGAIDGRFLAFNIVTGQVRLSALNDGTTWTAQFFARSAAPDRWQSMVIGNREIWMIGETTGEVWYNSGATPQPFALVPGSLFDFGTCAPFSAIKAGGAIVWVSKTKDGIGRIIRAAGYDPQPISNYAVDTALAAYARSTTISDAETLTYEQEGHLWAVFSFPSGPGTWAVDLETGAWHELGAWNATANRFDAWAPRVHCYAFNRHLVGDRTTNIMAELDVTIGTDLAAPIRRLRIGPPLWARDRRRLQVSRFGLMLEAGLGLTDGQGSDPKVMLRTSTDAKTWSAERWARAGRLGEYHARTFWTRCGSSDTVWVPEVSMSDAIPWRIAAANIEGASFGQVAA